MQKAETGSPLASEYCQLDIFADENLDFSVRVRCGSRRLVAGGFMNPDEAQRYGMHALLAMSGMPLEKESATGIKPAAGVA